RYSDPIPSFLAAQLPGDPALHEAMVVEPELVHFDRHSKQTRKEGVGTSPPSRKSRRQGSPPYQGGARGGGPPATVVRPAIHSIDASYRAPVTQRVRRTAGRNAAPSSLRFPHFLRARHTRACRTSVTRSQRASRRKGEIRGERSPTSTTEST